MKRLAQLGLATLTMTTTLSAASQLILLGTSSNNPGTNRGIYAVRLDSATGAFSPATLAIEAPNPGFLAAHPNRQIIYASGENGIVVGRAAAGAAAGFTLDSATGQLTALNQQATGGFAVTHLVADATGRMVVTVSYNGGEVVAFPIKAEGKLGALTSSHRPTGPLGPNSARQDKPHPHSVTLSPDNRFAYVCILGIDLISCYRLDPAAATLTPAGEFPTAPGAGPRHSKFSADGRFLYVINELNGTISVHACDPATGALTSKQIVATLPGDFHGPNTTAEIRLHPTGRFVYGSNRGHDSLAVFARNETDGTLTRLEIVSSGGGHPRNFALSPDGTWLVCANRDSDNLASFRVDATTGRLTPTCHTTKVPTPTCVLFCSE